MTRLRRSMTIRNSTTQSAFSRPEEKHKEAKMPVILLWVGLPILLLGGGYFIVQSMN